MNHSNDKATKREGRYVDHPIQVKFTHDQFRRVQALCLMFPNMKQSDVIRALVGLALPRAEKSPASLWMPPQASPGVEVKTA